MPGILLHAWWLGRKIFSVSMFTYKQGFLFKDSGQLSMPRANSGTCVMLTKPYLGFLDPYWIKSIWSRSLFPCMDLSQVLYIIWTLRPVNDLIPGKKMAFLVLAAVSLLEGVLVSGQFVAWKDSCKTQLFGICIGQLLTFWSNALTLFFLMNMNKDVSGTRLLQAHFLSEWV